MIITKSFETSGGQKVEVTGQLVEYNQGDECVKIEFDFNVIGFGSQGGSVARSQFNRNGVDYVGVVGKLPLTQDQMDIVDEMRQELTIAKDNHPLTLAQEEYGTYEDAEQKHSWMKNTY
jgi:hypothetical protein